MRYALVGHLNDQWNGLVAKTGWQLIHQHKPATRRFFSSILIKIMNRYALLGLGVLMTLLCQTAVGQQQPPTPQLLSVFPPGAKVGEKTIVKIVEQSELEFADELIFSHPGITCTPKMRETNRFFPTPTRERNAFVVSVAANVPAGIYDVRAKCEYGVSNPRRFVISGQAEILEAEPNDRFDTANPVDAECTVNGNFEAGYDFFTVSVQAGQALLFSCAAERIDSKGDPVIALFDSNQRLIAKNHDTAGKDALVTYKARSDEKLYVRVHDLTFASQGGAGTTPYRLTISQSPWIDFVDPPVIPRSTVSKVKLYGRNLNGSPSGLIKDGIELEMIEATINPKDFSTPRFADSVLTPNQFSTSRLQYRWQGKHGTSNSVLIELTDVPVLREPNVKSLNLNSAVLGVFSESGEVDQFRFQAKKGERFWIEVVSQRLGFATDPLLQIEEIRKDKDGNETLRSVLNVDDFKPMTRPFRFRVDTEDPATIFEATADGDYQISINDQFNLPPNHNGPNYYLLRFRKPSPRVELVAIPGLELGPNENNSRPMKIYPCIVRPDSGAEIQVLAYRSPGFNSSIELRVTGLPAGVTAEPAIINGESNHGTIILKGSATLQPALSRIQVIGTYMSDGKKTEVAAAGVEITTNSIGNEPAESRLTDEMYVIADNTVQFPGKIQLAKKQFQVSRGGVIETKAKLLKNAKHQGQILQAFVYGLPRTVTKNSNSIPDNGSEVNYRIEFRQGSPAGQYSAFIRGYYEANTKRFENKYSEATKEQKRISTLLQELENEYRKTTQSRSQLTNRANSKKQSLSSLAAQLRTANTQVAQSQKATKSAEQSLAKLQKEHDLLTSRVTSIAQMADLEMDAAKKKSLAAELLDKKQKLTAMMEKLNVASKNLQSSQSKLATETKKRDEFVAQEKITRTEIAKLESELKLITAKEQELAKERTLGQTVKREVDQEANLARQASQQRRRRFHVYSDPIQITVDEFPVELTLSQADFSLMQGSSAKITFSLKRKFDFKGVVNLQLRPQGGANGWSLQPNTRFNENQTSLEAELRMQNNAKVGNFTGVIQATMRVGSTNLSMSIPLKVEVKPVPK